VRDDAAPVGTDRERESSGIGLCSGTHVEVALFELQEPKTQFMLQRDVEFDVEGLDDLRHT
jgi:hypothetical protein